MIKTFRCEETALIRSGHRSKRFRNIETVARRKLRMLETAATIDDLKAPPGNRLHLLSGDRQGQHSISINDLWRICFEWRDGDAYDVEIVDYH